MAENPKSEQVIKLGIARCLLGHAVRYDGGHKLDRYLRDTLGKYVRWVPVCPEVECGMEIPREAVRLVGEVGSPRLIGRKSGQDWSEAMSAWGRGKLDELERQGIMGYVFKYGSPSNGMSRVKVYQGGGRVLHSGTGFWTSMVMKRFPGLPFEDDGRLRDPVIRENFITRVFTLMRWRQARAKGMTPAGLVEFHTRHKLLIMAHSVDMYRAMGKVVARAGEGDPEETISLYRPMLGKALSYKPTVKKHANVLMHAMGYFKKDFGPDDKKELLELIDRYRLGLIPLIVPVTLINHHVRRYSKEYLEGQHYLNPYPAELMLRNHV